MTTKTIPTTETIVPHIAADTVLDYIRTYGTCKLVPGGIAGRVCICCTVYACADGTLAAPEQPYDKAFNRPIWVDRDDLRTYADGSDYSRLPGLAPTCSLIADDVNDWLDFLADWGRREVTGPEDDRHDLRYVATRCETVSRDDIREVVRCYLQAEMDNIVRFRESGNEVLMDSCTGTFIDIADMVRDIFGLYVSIDALHVYIS